MPELPLRCVIAPERLAAHHDLSRFRNGKHLSLDVWLRDRALASEGLSARTYVVCDAQEPAQVVGYYAIATALIRRAAMPSAKLRKGMPEDVPLLLIGRLAIDVKYQGKGIGTDLLIDALCRFLSVAEIAGARAVVAHAMMMPCASTSAMGFCSRHSVSARC
jgi:GNAT superfamily N-acetyltransferase